MQRIKKLRWIVAVGGFWMMAFAVTAQASSTGEVTNRTDANGQKQGFWQITGAMSSEAGYRADRIVEEGHFTDNRRTGIWKKYYPTGAIRSEITYKNGFPHGPYRIYYPSGTVEEEGDWQNMRNVNDFKRYHENGQVAQDFHFNDKGRRDGTQKYYYASGQPQLIVEITNGLTHGVYQTFYADGSPKERKEIVQGRVDPETIVHYPAPEGKIVHVADPLLQDGELIDDGEKSAFEDQTAAKVEEFDKTGVDRLYNFEKQVTQEGEFRNGRLWNGKWYRYDREGRLNKTEVYQNGKFVGYEISDAEQVR